MGTSAIDARVRTGRLHLVHRGVYAVGHKRLSQRARWLAAVLAYGEGAVLSHRSAAALWGLSRPRGAIDVTSAHGRRRRALILHRARLHPDERAVRDAIPVTSAARTLVDLAEVVDEKRLERAWEEADRLHLLRLPAVEAVCARADGRRALRPIRRLVAEAKAVARTRSPLEDRFQRFCHHFDLPPHGTNVDVLGSEVDVLWPAAKLIVELDSWQFHSHRAAFQRDRARDARLLVAGYRTIRVTHDRLDSEANLLAAEIRALLLQR